MELLGRGNIGGDGDHRPRHRQDQAPAGPQGGPHHLLVGSLVYVIVSAAWLGIAVGPGGAPLWVFAPGAVAVVAVAALAAALLLLAAVGRWADARGPAAS